MDKSLLDILNDEKRALRDVAYYKEEIENFANLSKEGDEFQTAACKRIAAERKEKLIEAEKGLIFIRRKIKEYFSLIEKA